MFKEFDLALPTFAILSLPPEAALWWSYTFAFEASSKSSPFEVGCIYFEKLRGLPITAWLPELF